MLFRSATVFRIGLSTDTWFIDKNDIGLPTARYKHGMIYARFPSLDDGFCRIVYVNVVQEYTGGGTFGPHRLYMPSTRA